jgi:hypothetical protein
LPKDLTGGRNAATIEVGADTAEGRAFEHPSGGFVDYCSLGVDDGSAIALVTVGPVSPTHDPVSGALEVRAFLSLNLDVAFMRGKSSPRPRKQTPLTRREIDVSGHRRKRDLVLIAEHDELFEFSGLTM